MYIDVKIDRLSEMGTYWVLRPKCFVIGIRRGYSIVRVYDANSDTNSDA